MAPHSLPTGGTASQTSYCSCPPGATLSSQPEAASDPGKATGSSWGASSAQRRCEQHPGGLALGRRNTGKGAPSAPLLCYHLTGLGATSPLGLLTSVLGVLGTSVGLEATSDNSKRGAIRHCP